MVRGTARRGSPRHMDENRRLGGDMKLIIVIRLDNAAFDPEPGPEVSRILRQLADLAEREMVTANVRRISVLRDSNGNSVGAADVHR